MIGVQRSKLSQRECRSLSGSSAGWIPESMSALLDVQVLIVLHSYTMPRTPPVFTSATGTLANSDLAFSNVGPNSLLLVRRVLEKFPRSQYGPSLITPSRFALSVPCMPVKRWNFRKTKRSHYIALKNKFAKTLLSPDSLVVDAAYQGFCNIIKKAAKKTFPRGDQNNYIACWDAECSCSLLRERLKFGCYSFTCQT